MFDVVDKDRTCTRVVSAMQPQQLFENADAHSYQHGIATLAT